MNGGKIMMTKEQIAHDLAMVYMYNRYGITVKGDVARGWGEIETKHFPSSTKFQYEEVELESRDIWGFNKTEKVEKGRKVDAIFQKMAADYQYAYQYFYDLIRNS